MKKFKEENLTNDFLFGKTMEQEEICKGFLELVLGFEIEKLEYIEGQKTEQDYYNSKGVRFDVYAKDEIGTIYNVEMQTGNTQDLPKRTRYYQSRIDSDLLKKGEDYKNLKNSIIIFICTFDLFGEGFYQYTFRNNCLQKGDLTLGDGTTKIFLNTKGCCGNVSKEIISLLHYIESSKESVVVESGSIFLKKLHQQVQKIKNDNRWEMVYVTLENKIEEGRKEGRQEGRQEMLSKLELLCQKLKQDNRAEDFLTVMEDKRFRDEMFKKYNI